MNNIILGNLISGKLGRSSLFSNRPTFYLGQTSICNVYFEDRRDGGYSGGARDGYTSSLQNVDKSGVSLTVKVGERGQSPILTQTSWSNLATTIAITQAFAHHKLIYSFDRTPLTGYFTIAISGTVTLPDLQSAGAQVLDVPFTISYPAHTLLRDSTSGKIYADSSESEIEDIIKMMFREIVDGATGIFKSKGQIDASNGKLASSAATDIYDSYILRNSTISPQVEVTNVADNEWAIRLYVPDFELDRAMVYKALGFVDATTGGFASSSADDIYKAQLATAAGRIAIDDIALTSVSLAGPAGKYGSLAFTAPGFSSALGTANEVELWLECILAETNTHTVCEGPILLKRPMS